MGRKVSDGKAFNLTVPGGEAVLDGELYRIDGLNGFAIGAVEVTDTDRTLAFESDTNAIHSINVPEGVDPAVGDVLYWTDASAFQSGPDDLVEAGSGPPCFFVTGAKVNGVVRGRVLNGVPADLVS